MNVIKYNVNSPSPCPIGRQYEYGKTRVVFEGYNIVDAANEIYFKFIGRTEDSKYLVPITDMTLDIEQYLTKHVGTFTCQLEEMNDEGTLVSQSALFRVVVKRSIKVGAEYEVIDPRLETIYQKYNAMYNTINETNNTVLENESQRQADWITLKQEVADAVASIDGKLDQYKASTTDALRLSLNGFIGEAEESIQTSLETYESQTDTSLSNKLSAYQSKTTSNINRMFDDSNRTSKEKIDALASELEQRRLAGEFNGYDGYSPSAKVEPATGGVEITITDKSGTTKEKVLNGRNGADGNDYVITDADKDEIADNVKASVNADINELKSDLSAVVNATGVDISIKTVNSVDEMTDTSKQYVLKSTGTLWVYSSTSKIPAFTNLATVISDGYRLNSSGGLTAEVGTTAIEDYIDYVTGDVLRVKGLNLGTKNCSLYNSSKSVYTNFKPTVGSVTSDITTTLNDGVYELTSGASANIKYIRVSGILSGSIDDVIVTRNEEITYTDGYAWVDTGVTPDSKDTLYDTITQNTSDISEVSRRVTALETGSETLTIPSFWQSAVDECISKIKALQVGRNCITFPFFSDNHQRNGYSGMLIAYIMKACNIPYCFFGGDSISSAIIADEAEMIEQDRLFDSIMSYVPNEKMCRAVGNHDGYWNDGTIQHYYGREQIYELFLREESVAQNKHFGDDGTYYYVDDIASKTRFIVMNTNKQRLDNVATGESIDDAQLEWLENKALSFDESGWAVVFIGHAPITNNYHAYISNAQAVQSLLTNYINGASVNKADVVGWFSGHIHRDRFYKCDATGNNHTEEGNPVYDASNPSTNTLPWMTVTITSDYTSISYDDSTKHLVANDDNSHAIDFVTINKSTRTVNLTRLGIGADRSYTY